LLCKTKGAKRQDHVSFCGPLRPLISELADTGADIIQSIQPLAVGMDSFALKRDFGSRRLFSCGIDVQQAMTGTLADVEEE